MSLHKKIEEAFRDSIKTHNKEVIRAYRLLISEMQRRHSLNVEMSDKEIISLIKKYINLIKETEKITKQISPEDKIAIEVYLQYLPVELTEDEIKEKILHNFQEIKELNSSERIKQMGRIMKFFNGQADGNVVRKILNEI